MFKIPELERSLSASDHDTRCSDSSAVADAQLDFHVENNIASSLTFTVKGIFTKCLKPGARFLPLGFTSKDFVSRDQFMCRKRVYTKPMDFDISKGKKTHGNAFEIAHFRPNIGLAPLFWHNDQKIPGGQTTAMGYRAILFQSVEHYQALEENPDFQDNFKNIDYMDSPSFGEQVIVEGCDSTQLAIGDIFAVEGGPTVSTLVIEITSPRKPCFHVNKKHGTAMGPKGIQRHTLTYGLAGWFTSVIVAGELRDGMRLVRIKHPNPKWTLSYISKKMFGEASKRNHTLCKAEWLGGKKELEELINLPQLGEYEWKEDAKQLLKKWDENSEITTATTGTSGTMNAVRKNPISSFIGALQILLLARTGFDIIVTIVVLGYFVFIAVDKSSSQVILMEENST